MSNSLGPNEERHSVSDLGINSSKVINRRQKLQLAIKEVMLYPDEIFYY